MSTEAAEETQAEQKILVIDDDTLIRRVLCAALKKMGYATLEAPTGEAGLVEFKRSKPFAVITDVLMPDKNGLQTINELRALDPQVKIIAMSGGGSGQDGQDFLEMAQELGAAATLSKPFEAEDVQKALDAITEKA